MADMKVIEYETVNKRIENIDLQYIGHFRTIGIKIGFNDTTICIKEKSMRNFFEDLADLFKNEKDSEDGVSLSWFKGKYVRLIIDSETLDTVGIKHIVDEKKTIFLEDYQ